MRFTLDSKILVRAATSPRGPALRLLDIASAATRWFYPDLFSTRSSACCFIHESKHVTESPSAKWRAWQGIWRKHSHIVEPVITRPLVLTDPDDDPVLYTAEDGEVDVLYTRNIRHFAAVEVQTFCVARGIRVMTDVEALHDLLTGSQDAAQSTIQTFLP